jgi:hypothetical protein
MPGARHRKPKAGPLFYFFGILEKFGAKSLKILDRRSRRVRSPFRLNP